VLEYIDEAMPPETPLAFGLHPNAEIGFKLREAERFCANVLCLQPREAGGEGGMSVEEKAKMVRLARLQPPKQFLSSCLSISWYPVPLHQSSQCLAFGGMSALCYAMQATLHMQMQHSHRKDAMLSNVQSVHDMMSSSRCVCLLGA